MKLHIESPHMKLNKELTDLVRTKFDHLGKRYSRISHCDVVLREGLSDMLKYFSVEAKMAVPQTVLFASDRDVTFEMALDKVVHDLEHQLRRYKEELQERR